MPFRSFDFSWRRVCSVVVLALTMIVAPQATELCGAACARAAGHMAAMPMAAMPMPAAEPGAGHCAAHAASSHALHAAHACGMPAHALPVQVDETTATVTPARATLAQLPQPTQTAALPAVPSDAIAPPQHIPLRIDHTSTRSPRSRPLTLTLRL